MSLNAAPSSPTASMARNSPLTAWVSSEAAVLMSSFSSLTRIASQSSSNGYSHITGSVTQVLLATLLVVDQVLLSHLRQLRLEVHDTPTSLRRQWTACWRSVPGRQRRFGGEELHVVIAGQGCQHRRPRFRPLRFRLSAVRAPWSSSSPIP